MKSVSVCVPVLKRYDLLRGLLLSLERSELEPDMVHIIDNGRNRDRMVAAMRGVDLRLEIYTPSEPLGVASSWNTFIASVPEERVIVNDDVTFAPDSLARLVAPEGDIVFAAGCGFSCFALRDSCVDKVGLFDASISPGYGYYEDEDYLQRIDGKGTRPSDVRVVDVECGVTHLKSQTLAAATPEELYEHHRRFMIAQANYIKKWSLEETFK